MVTSWYLSVVFWRGNLGVRILIVTLKILAGSGRDQRRYVYKYPQRLYDIRTMCQI
jgi:hypothetical protein